MTASWRSSSPGPACSAMRPRCRFSIRDAGRPNAVSSGAMPLMIARGAAPPAVAYVYAGGRSMADLASQVQGFTGILQVDGYGSYKGLARRHTQIQLAFCLAHARRKFVAVYKATHAPLARDVIAALSEVYAIEARIRGRSAAERRAVRQAETKPIMDALKARLMTALAELPSRSSLVEAIKYMLGHWAGLTVFLADGRIEVDTNTVERTMRPIAEVDSLCVLLPSI